MVAAAYAGMVALDVIYRWPPAWADVALWVIVIAAVAYMLLRREHVRERYEAQQHAPAREPVEVRAGVRGIWDRLWNLDLAIERWRWSEPLAVGLAFVGILVVVITLFSEVITTFWLLVTLTLTVLVAFAYATWRKRRL